jgi:hypothetical protein
MMTAAIVLGVIVAVVAGCLLDVSGDWEGTAALAFMFVIVGAPFWIAQGVCTLLATLDGATPWLWAWFLGAPVLGTAIRRSLSSTG